MFCLNKYLLSPGAEGNVAKILQVPHILFCNLFYTHSEKHEQQVKYFRIVPFDRTSGDMRLSQTAIHEECNLCYLLEAHYEQLLY